jgi:hypothetical protein
MEEALMSKTLLSDVAYVRLSLAESTGDRVKVRGEFAKCGIATENRRVYPKPIWEKEIKRLNKALKERRVFGEIDHPSDGQTKLSRVSHIVTGLSIENGIVVGEAEILPTEAGKNLLAIMEANVPVGVSSRGFGSVKSNDKNEDVVQEDYRLVTFDFVADPADQDAYPSVSESRTLFEGVQFDLDADEEQERALEVARQIEADRTGKKVEATETLREEFAREILENLSKIREQVRSEVRDELLNDPSLAGAKTALESVRAILTPYLLPEEAAVVVKAKTEEVEGLKNQLAEKELRIKELESENTSIAEMAKEVGYRFYLERVLSNDVNADAIRTMVGDVKKYADSTALKESVKNIRSELAKKESERKALAEAKAREIAEREAAAKKLEEQFNAKLSKVEQRVSAERQKREALEAELEELRKENGKLSTRAYAESRLSNHPRAAKLRSLVESVESEDAVDTILESDREPERDADDLQEVRARIRSKMRGGTEHAEELTESRRTQKKDFMGLGTSLEQLRHLSGISGR